MTGEAVTDTPEVLVALEALRAAGCRVWVGGGWGVDALLPAFYTHVFGDPMLGRIFVEVAHMDLERHLPALGDFWEKVLFNTGEYGGKFMRTHQRVHDREPFTPAHFERWLAMWSQTIDERHAGPTADQAKQHASRIAVAMRRKLFSSSGQGRGPEQRQITGRGYSCPRDD